MMQDIRYALRVFARMPGFTLIAVLALALGIGANTAIFSVVNTALLRPLPYPDSDRVVVLWENNTRQGWSRTGVSGQTYEDWKDENTVFEELSLHQPGTGTLTGMGEPEQVPGMRVTTNFFRLLGAKAELGRLFSREEGGAGRHNVLVITDAFWRTRLGADPHVIGKTYKLDGLAYTVIGVLSPQFWFPIKEMAYVPWSDQELRGISRDARSNGVLGRLKPGVTVEQARAAMDNIARRIRERDTNMHDWGVTVMPMRPVLTESIRPALLVLMGAVAFVLLIACTNIANLLLARGAGRLKEVAIRTAAGAGRLRLVRQFLTESVVLGIAGGAVGLLLAMWGIQVLSSVLPAHISVPGSSEPLDLPQASFDFRVLLFTAAVSIGTGVLFGLVPALVATAGRTGEILKQGGRSSSAGGHAWVRNALVASEIALALVLLAGAGLMIRSFWQLQQANPGFRADHVLTLEMELPTDSKYQSREEQSLIFQRFLRAVEPLPGVKAAALTHIVPFTDYEDRRAFEIVGRPEVARMEADYRIISPDYFRALGIPMVRGREFSELDTREGPCVVVIDQALARPYFGNDDPVGHEIAFPNGRRDCRIVGVAAAVKDRGLNRQPRPTIYVTYLRVGAERMSLVVRTAADPAAMANAIKRAVWSVDREQPLYNIKTMDELIEDTESSPRFTLVLLGVFAALALVLAAIGVYGVMSYTVNQRTHELGIRMALGAGTEDVLRLVVGSGLRIAAAGVAAGLLGAFALTRVLGSLLYGVSATDPATYAVVAAALGVVAAAACYVPARRATRVSPVVALRGE